MTKFCRLNKEKNSVVNCLL